MHAVVCVRLCDPTYDRPTRDRLATAEATEAVRVVVASAFDAFLRREPKLLQHLVASLSPTR
jgi:DNA gyrase/topoisomerase IV subunit B